MSSEPKIEETDETTATMRLMKFFEAKFSSFGSFAPFAGAPNDIWLQKTNTVTDISNTPPFSVAQQTNEKKIEFQDLDAHFPNFRSIAESLDYFANQSKDVWKKQYENPKEATPLNDNMDIWAKWRAEEAQYSEENFKKVLVTVQKIVEREQWNQECERLKDAYENAKLNWAVSIVDKKSEDYQSLMLSRLQHARVMEILHHFNEPEELSAESIQVSVTELHIYLDKFFCYRRRKAEARPLEDWTDRCCVKVFMDYLDDKRNNEILKKLGFQGSDLISAYLLYCSTRAPLPRKHQ